MKHISERTPDYILIVLLLLYIIGHPLQSCWNRGGAEKNRTEIRVK